MRRQVAILATVIAMAAAAPAASAFEGFSGRDRDSLNVRHMQSQLMVAALSCNLRPQYNATINRFEVELIRHGHDLKQLAQPFCHRIGQQRVGQQPQQRCKLLSGRCFVIHRNPSAAGLESSGFLGRAHRHRPQSIASTHRVG